MYLFIRLFDYLFIHLPTCLFAFLTFRMLAAVINTIKTYPSKGWKYSLLIAKCVCMNVNVYVCLRVNVCVCVGRGRVSL